MKTVALRQTASVVIAIAITFTLYTVMQRMISKDVQLPTLSEEFDVIQFVRYQPQEETPPEQKQELPPPPENIKPPEVPPLEVTAPVAQADSPPLQRLDINLPLRMTGTPFIGVAAPSNELGEAIPLVRIPPRYPTAAKRRKLSGKVVVEFTINEQGLVEAPQVIEATPPNIFDNAALQAILRWKFKPKVENGKTVKRKARQELIFEPPQ